MAVKYGTSTSTSGSMVTLSDTKDPLTADDSDAGAGSVGVPVALFPWVATVRGRRVPPWSTLASAVAPV